jgi:DNA-directed RNA polymerase subunit RPC12/RpoP
MPIFFGLCTWLVIFYYKKVVYICPACHKVFRPTVKKFMFSTHTPTTRKLTCPACGHRGFCVETHHTTLKEKNT